MQERHRRHSQSFNQPYCLSNKHKVQTAFEQNFNNYSKQGKQNSHDASRQQSGQYRYHGRVKRAVLEQSNHQYLKVQKSNESKKYQWNRQTKQNFRAKNHWAQEIPSFGNTIRQASPEKSSNQRFFHQKQSSLHSNIRQNQKYDPLQNEKIDQYSVKSWDKTISSNMRSQQLKQISKERFLNINKINCKIKSILDKLNEEEAIYPNQQVKPRRISVDSKQFNRVELSQFNGLYSRQFKRVDSHQFNRVKLRNPLRASNFVNYGQQKMISKQKRVKTQFQQQDNSCCSKVNLRHYQRQKSNKSRDKYEFNIEQSRSSLAFCNQIQTGASGYYQYPDSRVKYQVKQKRQPYENYEKKKAESRLCPAYSKHQSRITYEGKHNFKRQTQNSQINRSLSYVRKKQVVDPEQRIQIRRELSQHRLKSGKNLQAQIQKIQAKIQKSNLIKNELKIQDEPKRNHHTKEIQKRNFPSIQPKKSPNQQQHKDAQSQQIYLPKPFLMTKNRASKRETFRSQISIDEPNQSKYEQKTLTKQEQIENRSQHRRILKLQFSTPVSTQQGQDKQLQIFIQNIHKQIQYDSEFRNAKKWFERYLMDAKWQKLKILLKENGFSMSIQQVKKIFQIDEDQVNPFFSSRQANLSLQELVDSYIKSRDFWNQRIYRAFNREKLVKGGFVERNLDLDKKGSITIEDFIRFINFQRSNFQSTFYRTRDMILIFRRISSHFQTSFDNLIEIFCQ